MWHTLSESKIQLLLHKVRKYLELLAFLCTILGFKENWCYSVVWPHNFLHLKTIKVCLKVLMQVRVIVKKSVKFCHPLLKCQGKFDSPWASAWPPSRWWFSPFVCYFWKLCYCIPSQSLKFQVVVYNHAQGRKGF